MSTSQASLRIGVFGTNGAARNERHGCGLWAAGYQSIVTAAGATAVLLGDTSNSRPWDDLLADCEGVILASPENPGSRHNLDAENLCRWCEEHALPLLAIDTGMHLLNSTYSGGLFSDLPRELPEALQHRHPPERGLRHAIAITPGSRLAELYGDGEVVVNSEHRRAVQRVGRGLQVTARALDGVIEAIEAEDDSWFCLGVQWQPASATASGLDIQLFRGLIDASQHRLEHASGRVVCAA
jgi:hypothetical protein